jgi:hypothetical protein
MEYDISKRQIDVYGQYQNKVTSGIDTDGIEVSVFLKNEDVIFFV